MNYTIRFLYISALGLVTTIGLARAAQQEVPYFKLRADPLDAGGDLEKDYVGINAEQSALVGMLKRTLTQCNHPAGIDLMSAAARADSGLWQDEDTFIQRQLAARTDTAMRQGIQLTLWGLVCGTGAWAAQKIDEMAPITPHVGNSLHTAVQVGAVYAGWRAIQSLVGVTQTYLFDPSKQVQHMQEYFLQHELIQRQESIFKSLCEKTEVDPEPQWVLAKEVKAVIPTCIYHPNNNHNTPIHHASEIPKDCVWVKSSHDICDGGVVHRKTDPSSEYTLLLQPEDFWRGDAPLELITSVQHLLLQPVRDIMKDMHEYIYTPRGAVSVDAMDNKWVDTIWSMRRKTDIAQSALRSLSYGIAGFTLQNHPRLTGAWLARYIDCDPASVPLLHQVSCGVLALLALGRACIPVHVHRENMAQQYLNALAKQKFPPITGSMNLRREVSVLPHFLRDFAYATLAEKQQRRRR